MEKKVITCRFKLKIVNNACNLPLLAKQMVKLYRDADVSLNVIPFTGGDDCILDHEDNIPTDEEQIKNGLSILLTLAIKFISQ